MKFIIDAQLPKKIALLFHENGFDAKHTLDLPNKIKTTDSEILSISDLEK